MDFLLNPLFVFYEYPGISFWMDMCFINLFQNRCLCLVMSQPLRPLDYSLPGSSVHGIFQARILEWVAISSSSESSQTRDWTCVSYTADGFFIHWAIRESCIIPSTFTNWHSLWKEHSFFSHINYQYGLKDSYFIQEFKIHFGITYFKCSNFPLFGHCESLQGMPIFDMPTIKIMFYYFLI